jgi:AraC-like DNA-binding protein
MNASAIGTCNRIGDAGVPEDVTVLDTRGSQPIGRFASMARGSLASVSTFGHTGEHRDPREEWNDVPCVIFTSRGSWEFRSSNASGRADPDHAIVAGAGVAYACRHDERRPTDRTVDVTLFGSTDAWRWIDGRAAVVPLTPELHRARTRLLAASLALDDAHRLRTDLAAVELVGALVAPPPPVTDDPDAVDAALVHMRANLTDDLDLAILAGVAALSPFHFVRLFRRRVGEPPVRHLRRLRLERAALLLRESDEPVTGIALDAGFGSLSNFVTAFREAFGASPGRWRRARQLADESARRN